MAHGGSIAGVVPANNGGSGRSQLDGWTPTTIDEWEGVSPYTPMGESFGDFDERSADRPLVFGGSASVVDTPGGTGFTSAGPPPFEGPRIYIRERMRLIHMEDKMNRRGPYISFFDD